MNTGLIVIHFGEPSSPDRQSVERYLERIFRQNMDLEDVADPDARIEALVDRRTPALLEEYEAIGGSPLNEQAEHQVDALATLLDERGFDLRVTTAYQFVDPSIADALATLRDAGCTEVIALSLYPLCGPTTTVAAAEEVERFCSEDPAWDPEVTQLTGWHRHPDYLRLRAANLRSYLERHDLDPYDSATSVLWSAHGTPMKHVDAGSRYVSYVEEYCAAVGALADVPAAPIGFQNHENRGIEWTTPAIEDVVVGSAADQVVVEPVSFMHEQSETLSELDIELAAEATDRGLSFHRIPVPHDDELFPAVLADLVEPLLAGVQPELFQLRRCVCHDGDRTFCRNAP